MNIMEIDISKIKVAPYNPRKELEPGTHEYEVIKRSIKEFDLVEPLVWNQKTGNLISGHQRFKILKERGDKKIPVSVVDLSVEKERALNITLNNQFVNGLWDESALSQILKEIELTTPDLYDSLEMAPLSKLEADGSILGEQVSDQFDEFEEGPPEMELLPYEHYDYIVLFFRDSRDFMAALDHFEINKVAVPGYVGKKKIGIGRVIDGARYLAKTKGHTGSHPKSKKS